MRIMLKMAVTMLNPGAMVILSLHLQLKVTVYFSICYHNVKYLLDCF